jgi:alpha-galactosidase
MNRKLSYLVLVAVAFLIATPVPSALADPSRVILTPKPKPEPRINGARAVGVRPGSPFLFLIPATGERPMAFAAENLPAGLTLDAASGRITGSLKERGTNVVTVRATNARGSAERKLRIVVGDDIALTPPMGCNTYGGWGPFVTEKSIRDGAEALMKSGLNQHGYSYVNIDDGWQGKRGGKFNAIQPNEKFGDLHSLCEHLHSLGLHAGIYSTPWTSSYEGFIGGSSDNDAGDWTRPNPPRSGIGKYGRYTFETNDAAQIAAWGFDYFKYDWALDRRDAGNLERARRMSDALRHCGRDVVMELSNYAPLDEAADFTATVNMCRTTGDIVDVWHRSQLDAEKQNWAFGVRDIWNHQKLWAKFNRPGHWNMPCPLRVGVLGGWDLKPLQPTRLTPNEQYSHISLWCLWSAPLIIGCPPERLDEFTLSLLSNDEVLEVDQDPLGRQARQIEVEGGEVLIKELEDGSKAAGLFNPGPKESRVTIRWSEMGIKGPHTIRDLWRQKNLGVFTGQFSATVASHGVVLVKFAPSAKP